ncbi:MAG: aminopeptidase P family protein [Bacteroidales bacterium]|nr:aminopeptidase P family protein [Bacteroidales bacterium]
MFESSIYKQRRAALLEAMRAAGQHGIMAFLGNSDVTSQGTHGSVFRFHQDSAWVYFFGVDRPDWAAIMDLDSGEEKMYADDVDLDDIVWMGPQTPVAEMAAWTGVSASAPMSQWFADVQRAVGNGRRVHFLPTFRKHNLLRLAAAAGQDAVASEEMTKAVIGLRLIKQECEIEELDKAGDLGFRMHEIALNNLRPGAYEDEIAALMEYFAKSNAWGLSFETILTQHGETLHNSASHKQIEKGNLVVVDAGVESLEHYVSDHTRTYPSSGKFTTRQREIYQIVLDCHEQAFSQIRPGITYRQVHLNTVHLMLEELQALGLVKGDVDEMVAKGIGGLFMPHGLGHNMGIDVHDMEEYGEDLVGYDPDQTRAKQLGLGNLRMARKLVPGHVITDEPGIYFIPALIEKFKKEGLGYGFVNYQALEGYYDFGGIRIEDDILVTPDGARRLGHHRLPATVEEIEAAFRQ